MRYEKGKQKTGGRIAGTPNKIKLIKDEVMREVYREQLRHTVSVWTVLTIEQIKNVIKTIYNMAIGKIKKGKKPNLMACKLLYDRIEAPLAPFCPRCRQAIRSQQLRNRPIEIVIVEAPAEPRLKNE